MSNATRQEVVDHLEFKNESEKSDLLDPNKTNTNLIQALVRLTFAPPVGTGHKVLITSVRTDHGDDSGLGPHCHARGFAVDLWPQDEANLHAVLQDLCTNNREVIKVGRGGISRDVNVTAGSTIVFDDNSTDHIHVEVGGGAI